MDDALCLKEADQTEVFFFLFNFFVQDFAESRVLAVDRQIVHVTINNTTSKVSEKGIVSK